MESSGISIMASIASDSLTNEKKYDGDETNEAMGSLLSKISQLKKQIQADRFETIKEKLGRNAEKLKLCFPELLSVAETYSHTIDGNGQKNMLSHRIENPLFKLIGYSHGSGEKDGLISQEVMPPTIKLPYVEKIPPYTTWMFLDKNQRMAEDQSVVGRRQIYYDQCGGETLISSDSDTEVAEPEEPRHDFSGGEDKLLWMVLQEHGLTQEVLDVLSQFIGVASSEIQERYNILMEKYQQKHAEAEGSGENQYENGTFLDKSLDVALDSFDNLFCRRCLVFDCRLHGCSQNLVIPCEKQPCFSELGQNGKPCSDKCYLLSRKQIKDACGSETALGEKSTDKRIVVSSTETAIAPEGFAGDANEVTTMVLSEETLENSVLKHNRKVQGPSSGNSWRPIEKDLYMKGAEIFGKNSCLITRNLLSGLKTCMEVYTYMFKDGDSKESCTALSNSRQEDGTAENNYKDQEIPSRSRLLRKRGRAKKLKYSWKSSGHPSSRKRMADGKQQLVKLYTPCGCESMCGKQCPCVENGTCCEKYCGCSKSCKNRFRGCHCAKSQCRSRQCPCFAASRECDPDVCRNCWVSCGDGTLGQPPSRGDGYQCGNMKLLLKQQQRILLAKSSVAGWGAFIKNPVNKNDYLGEYTGEIISQKEADKRGKIYDRSNSSFLFDLNDQYVLDAYRKGDKLKFANHSATPNCYAKVMMVAGDHRVGIFAKEHIEASEELFYDYYYGPDQAPPWARKPEGSKKDESIVPHGRARKHQSS